jgi:hypothetical protein
MCVHAAFFYRRFRCDPNGLCGAIRLNQAFPSRAEAQRGSRNQSEEVKFSQNGGRRILPETPDSEVLHCGERRERPRRMVFMIFSGSSPRLRETFQHDGFGCGTPRWVLAPLR